MTAAQLRRWCRAAIEALGAEEAHVEWDAEKLRAYAWEVGPNDPNDRRTFAADGGTERKALLKLRALLETRLRRRQAAIERLLAQHPKAPVRP